MRCDGGGICYTATQNFLSTLNRALKHFRRTFLLLTAIILQVQISPQMKTGSTSHHLNVHDVCNRVVFLYKPDTSNRHQHWPLFHQRLLCHPHTNCNNPSWPWEVAGVLKFKYINITAIWNVSALSAECPAKKEKRKTRMREDTALLHRNNYRKQWQTYFLSKQMYCFWWRSHNWYCFPHIGHSCICTEFPKPLAILILP